MYGLLGGRLLMTQLIDVPRYTLIFTILLLFILFSPMIASAKHIIVIYDVSGSMVSLGRGNNVKIFIGIRGCPSCQ